MLKAKPNQPNKKTKCNLLIRHLDKIQLFVYSAQLRDGSVPVFVFLNQNCSSNKFQFNRT